MNNLCKLSAKECWAGVSMASVHDRRVVSCSMNTNGTTMMPLLCIVLCVQASVAFLVHPQENESSQEEDDFSKQLEDAFLTRGPKARHTVIRNLFRSLELHYRKQLSTLELHYRKHLSSLELHYRETLATEKKELSVAKDKIEKLTLENIVFRNQTEGLSCRLWYVKIRIVLEDYEKRYGSDVNCTLSKEEEKGLGNTEKDRTEKARRRKAKMWRKIFEKKGDEYPIKKLRATIEARKTYPKNYVEFCDGLSVVIDILHKQVHVYLDVSELGFPNPMRLFEKADIRATFITVFESEYGENLLPCLSV